MTENGHFTQTTYSIAGPGAGTSLELLSPESKLSLNQIPRVTEADNFS